MSSLRFRRAALAAVSIFAAASMALSNRRSIEADASLFCPRIGLDSCDVEVNVDSGLVENTGAGFAVVFSETVTVPEASTMSPYFSVVQLSGEPSAGTGSFVRITSPGNGETADWEAQSLEVGELLGGGLAYRGDTLELELFAYGGTGLNRIAIDFIQCGQPADRASRPEWLCYAQDRFVRGDGNQDGRVDLSDAIFLLNNLFVRCTILYCPDSYDANDDGAIDLSDGVAIVSFLFLGSPISLPPPFSECGADPTEDPFEGVNGDCHYRGPGCGT